MVNIRIVVEGGVLSHDNISADTFDNSERFRESFHQLLAGNFDSSTFNIEVEIGGGYAQAAKSFKQLQKSCSNALLIDMDGPEKDRAAKIEELELEAHNDSVFFMIQEMEGWILSQPNCIEAAFAGTEVKQKNNTNYYNDQLLATPPQEIAKPSEKLHILLGRYFYLTKNGKTKKKKYGKLKDGALFLAKLSMTELAEAFEDVKKLHAFINEASIEQTHQ